MTLGFYLKIKIGKFFANLLSDFYRNRDKRHQVREKLDPLNPDRCVRYLKKYFVDVLPLECTKNTAEPEVSPIWVCWFQGIEHAPAIVQNCLKSLYKYKRDNQQVYVITANNFQEYVSIPQAIVEKWKHGIVDNTHFSDILRLHLLARHGGLWIDSTCMLLGTIPTEILEQDFFLFHSHGEFSYTLIQSCFIRSAKNQYIIRKWAAALDLYWIKESRSINYFIPHLLYIALLQTDEKFAKDFSRIPLIDDSAMHFILDKMMAGEAYSSELLDKARTQCFIQKLTYKIPAHFLNDECSIAHALSEPTFQP